MADPIVQFGEIYILKSAVNCVVFNRNGKSGEVQPVAHGGKSGLLPFEGSVVGAQIKDFIKVSFGEDNEPAIVINPANVESISKNFENESVSHVRFKDGSSMDIPARGIVEQWKKALSQDQSYTTRLGG